jgi:HD-like signal output (HDOD) protein/two-component sensor histidine kinase
MISYQDSTPGGDSKTTNTISHLLAGSKNLPTLPEINLKLIKACNNGHENIGELADLIKMDPALTLKIMDLYYSDSNRIPKKLNQLESALHLIGIDAIRIMVSCNSTSSILDGMINGRNFDLKLFWKHSLKCAFLAELISKDIPNQSPYEAFLTGLFHDIGKLVLFATLPNLYGKILADKTDHGNLLLREKKTIGIDHCEIAYNLIDRWHYYPFMADAILFHHYPVEKVTAALPSVKIIYLANLLAEQEMMDQKDVFNTAKTLLGFTQDKVERYLQHTETKLNYASAAFGIDDIPSGQTVNNGRIDVRLNLANEVRDRSLIAYTMQNVLHAKDKQSILKIMIQGFQILFGKFDIFFFLYNKDEDSLIGHCSKDDEFSALIDGSRISFSSNNSMLASCLHSKSPIDSFSFQKTTDLAIMDSQLIHFTRKEGLLCLPMIDNDQPIGTIVLGVDKAECSFLYKQINLLNSFARYCATAILEGNRKEDSIKQPQPVLPAPEQIVSRKIIHEINNPLSVIKNYLKVLGMKLSDHDIDHDEIRIINDEINRIIKMLRKFSASPAKEYCSTKEPVNINDLLLDIVRLTVGSLENDAGIRINLDNDPSTPEIMTERDNLKQVFINLINNAMEAMPGGGNIHVKTSYSPDLGKNDGGNGSGISKGIIKISVTDDGPGIPDKIRSTIFDEFTTSKNGHEGLGLSIVKSIINKLNGSITCENPDKKGTRFIIDLPLKVTD